MKRHRPVSFQIDGDEETRYVALGFNDGPDDDDANSSSNSGSSEPISDKDDESGDSNVSVALDADSMADDDLLDMGNNQARRVEMAYKSLVRRAALNDFDAEGYYDSEDPASFFAGSGSGSSSSGDDEPHSRERERDSSHLRGFFATFGGRDLVSADFLSSSSSDSSDEVDKAEAEADEAQPPVPPKKKSQEAITPGVQKALAALEQIYTELARASPVKKFTPPLMASLRDVVFMCDKYQSQGFLLAGLVKAIHAFIPFKQTRTIRNAILRVTRDEETRRSGAIQLSSSDDYDNDASDTKSNDGVKKENSSSSARAPVTTAHRACAWCNTSRAAATLVRCKRCKTAVYCDTKCASGAWHTGDHYKTCRSYTDDDTDDTV